MPRQKDCGRKPVLLALAMNRNFKDADGGLSLDAGPFVAALEYASKRKAILLAKLLESINWQSPASAAMKTTW